MRLKLVPSETTSISCAAHAGPRILRVLVAVDCAFHACRAQPRDRFPRRDPDRGAKHRRRRRYRRYRSDLNRLGLGDISIQGFGSETDVLVRVQRQEATSPPRSRHQGHHRALGGITTFADRIRRPTGGAELAEKGVLAVICALLPSWSISGSALNGSSPSRRFWPSRMMFCRPSAVRPDLVRVQPRDGRGHPDDRRIFD